MSGKHQSNLKRSRIATKVVVILAQMPEGATFAQYVQACHADEHMRQLVTAREWRLVVNDFCLKRWPHPLTQEERQALPHTDRQAKPQAKAKLAAQAQQKAGTDQCRGHAAWLARYLPDHQADVEELRRQRSQRDALRVETLAMLRAHEAEREELGLPISYVANEGTDR